jgi:hypothetical protein
MVKVIVALVVVLSLAFVSTIPAPAAQPGRTDTVFNRRFLPKIKPMMAYEHLVRIIGTQGELVGNRNVKSATVVEYSWNGRKKSTLRVQFSNGKLIEATMLAPNGHTYTVGRDGKTRDLGD